MEPRDASIEENRKQSFWHRNILLTSLKQTLPVPQNQGRILATYLMPWYHLGIRVLLPRPPPIENVQFLNTANYTFSTLLRQMRRNCFFLGHWAEVGNYRTLLSIFEADLMLMIKPLL